MQSLLHPQLHAYIINETYNGLYILFFCSAGPKPDNFHVVSTDIYTATLSWTVPKETLYYPVIKSYSIWYKSDTSGNKMFIYYASNSDTVTARVLDLQPDTWYTFKVKANFPIKSGPYSTEVHARSK